MKHPVHKPRSNKSRWWFVAGITVLFMGGYSWILWSENPTLGLLKIVASSLLSSAVVFILFAMLGVTWGHFLGYYDRKWWKRP